MPAARRSPHTARPCPQRLCACVQASPMMCPTVVPAASCRRSGGTHAARGLLPTGFVPAAWCHPYTLGLVPTSITSAARHRPRSARPCPQQHRAGCQASPAAYANLSPPASRRQPGVARVSRGLVPTGFLPAERLRPRSARQCPHRLLPAARRRRCGGFVSTGFLPTVRRRRCCARTCTHRLRLAANRRPRIARP